MATGRKNKIWILIILLLVAVIAIGAVNARSHFPDSEPVEIVLSSVTDITTPPVTSPASLDNAPQQININRAELWLLEALPGIGPVLAQRIIDYREQNGPFTSITQLAEIKGIGLDGYEKLKDLVTVTG